MSEASGSATTQTILSVIHQLAASHEPNLTAPYLHPHAPSSAYKGKARETVLTTEQELDSIRRLKEAVEAARAILAAAVKGSDDRDRVKLIRGLREVTTNQSQLLPHVSSLSHLPGPLSSKPIPSKLLPLSPIDLLTTLSQSLGISTYLEESQFGLLKTSLALAGTRFVVDVDLEVDASAGAEEDEDEDMVGEGKDDERGQVRLSKLTANHVLQSGETGKSDWVASVLRDKVERVLEGGDDWAREARIRDLERELHDLTALDKMEGDGFKELEKAALALQEAVKAQRIYAPGAQTVFPTFHLLPFSTAYNPLFKLRPLSPGERASPLSARSTGDEEGLSLFGADWVVECDCLPVSRDWLSPAAASPSSPQGVTTLEDLLYHSPATTASFPYTTPFIHSAPSSLTQYWSMAQPGPEGLVVGRIGCPLSASDLIMLRKQVVLNQLFRGIFDLKYQEIPNENEEEKEDENLEDLLAEPTAIPITVILHHHTLVASMPLPHAASAEPPTLTLTFASDTIPDSITLDWELDGEGDRERIEQAVRSGREAGKDLKEIVRRLERALKESM
ncbi:hypothetical protein P7C73_g3108, partial [Tremellales sp. Uapishka_1]